MLAGRGHYGFRPAPSAPLTEQPKHENYCSAPSTACKADAAALHHLTSSQEPSPAPDTHERSYLFDLLNVGYKKVWLEYDGVIRLGIDAKKVKVSGPDDSGRVTVTMPEAKVIGSPLIDENASSEIYTEKGLFTQITLKDQRDAVEVAQQKMLEAAQEDTELLEHARQRAQVLIEQYIKNVGQAHGVNYTVVFE